jgi:sulfite exporter TauE/SafE
LTGLFTTLLPCGWLYVFVAAAGGTGSVQTAMATMAIFWLGTLPALLAVGVGAQRLLAPFRRRLPALSATVVLIMGLLSMSGHLGGTITEHAVHGPAAVSTATTDHTAHTVAAPSTVTESAHEH